MSSEFPSKRSTEPELVVDADGHRDRSPPREERKVVGAGCLLAAFGQTQHLLQEELKKLTLVEISLLNRELKLIFTLLKIEFMR